MTLVGTHANAWDAEAVLANGLSPIVDLLDTTDLHVFGHTGAASTITILVSQDGVDAHFYAHDTIAANGDFSEVFFVGCRYARLKSSAAVTITAVIAAK